MKPFDTRYGKMSAFGKNDLISRALREYGEWSGLELALLSDLIPRGGVVVDAGAYIGTHARAFSAAVGPEGVVHAFEPNPDAFELLQRNAALAPYINITCHAMALGEHKGSVSILPASARLNAGTSRVVAPKEGGAAQRVDMVRLDEADIAPPDLIKIDVEGMEIAVLRGSEGLLADSDPVIFAECNSLDGGARLMQWARGQRLKVRGAWSPAYNPENFLGSRANEFGDASEIGLLLLSAARDKQFALALKAHRTVRIRSLDDLAMLLLKKTQYASEVLSRTSVAKVFGTDFSSPAATRLQELLDDARRDDAFHLRRISILEEEYERLSEAKAAAERISEQRTRYADELANALETTRALATARLAEIEALGARIADTDDALDQARRLAEERLLDLATEDAALSSLQVLANERLESITQLAKRIEATDEALEKARILAEERQAELVASHAALVGAEELATERLAAMEMLSGRLTRTDEALAAASRLAEERLVELGAQERALAKVEALATERLALIDGLTARLARTDLALAETERLAEQRLTELTELGGALDRLDALARERLATIEEQASRIDRTDVALEEARRLAEERLRLIQAADERYRKLEAVALQSSDENRELSARLGVLSEKVSRFDRGSETEPACAAELGNAVAGARPEADPEYAAPLSGSTPALRTEE